MKTRIIFMAMLLLLAVGTVSSQELKSGDIKRSTANCTNFDMVYVDGGTFNMLAPTATANVKVESFLIGKYEVTQELWLEVMGINNSNFKGDLLPVESISLNDIVGSNGFLSKLNALDIAPAGYKFTLPTNAQWEYAARGGKDNIGTYGTAPDFIYSGSNDADEVAWYSGNSESKLHKMGKKRENALGIYDMSGNVSEFVVDGKKYYHRGGSCKTAIASCRIDSFVAIDDMDKEGTDIGFRLALEPILPVDITVGGVTFKMIYVDKGMFEMGQADIKDAKPIHKVTLSSYYIAETEVTQALWKAIMDGNNPSVMSVGDEFPVNSISREMIQQFITKLNEATGKTFRLPTEAEWEFAARGGNKSKGYMYAGSNTLGEVAWYQDGSGATWADYFPRVVKSKIANELGIYDMSGNVFEFCSDYYAPYVEDAQVNPVGPSEGARMVYRGGCFGYQGPLCRVAYRSSTLPTAKDVIYGLRLVLVQ